MTEQIEITDNPEARRFEAHVDGDLAGFADYRDAESVRAFVHTEIDPAFGGRGIGSTLVDLKPASPIIARNSAILGKHRIDSTR